MIDLLDIKISSELKSRFVLKNYRVIHLNRRLRKLSLKNSVVLDVEVEVEEQQPYTPGELEHH